MDLESVTARTFEEVRPYTMCSAQNIAATIRLAIEAIEGGRKGDFAEFGTWRGGASFALLLAQRYAFDEIRRPVWMFDSFQGLPPADERDGPLALQYQRETDAPYYYDNCTAPLQDVFAAVKEFGFSHDEAVIVPGWFHDTIPDKRATLAKRGIAFLRIDCDWYEPVHYVLREATPLMPEGSTILLDDYFTWDGCARATHDFLSQNDLCWRIRSIDRFQGAWMIKQAHRAVGL